MTRADLKPCPFCGGPAYPFAMPVEALAEGYKPRAIGCPDCQFLLGDVKEDGDCIPRWNRRAPITLDEWEDSQ